MHPEMAVCCPGHARDHGVHMRGVCSSFKVLDLLQYLHIIFHTELSSERKMYLMRQEDRVPFITILHDPEVTR